MSKKPNAKLLRAKLKAAEAARKLAEHRLKLKKANARFAPLDAATIAAQRAAEERAVKSERRIADYRAAYERFGVSLSDETLAQLAAIEPIDPFFKFVGEDPDDEEIIV